MKGLSEFQLESRNRTQRDLEFILRTIKEVQPVSVNDPKDDFTVNILIYANDIEEKYLPHAIYSSETEKLIKKALTIGREFAYLDQLYQNYDKNKIPEDIQEIESILAGLDEQKETYNLDRTKQKEKYEKLIKWKETFLHELEHGIDKVRPHANQLFTELRKDILEHYKTALMEMSYSLS